MSNGVIFLKLLILADEKYKDRFPTKMIPYLSSDPTFSQMGLPSHSQTFVKEVAVNPLDSEAMRDTVFTVRVEGRPVYIMFKGDVGKRLVRSLKGLDVASLPTGFRFLRAVSGFFSAVYTVWNVGFIFTNFLRDVVSASLNLSTDADSKRVWNKILNPDTLFKDMKSMYSLSRERRAGRLRAELLSSSNRKLVEKVEEQLRKDRSNVNQDELNKVLDDPLMSAILFQNAGGQIEFFGLADVETKTQDIYNEVARIQKNPNASAENMFKKFFNLVNDINTGVENSVRLGAFRAMLRDGSSLQNSAFKGGREGTVDFNRKGNFTNIMNALFPFFGAGVSGNARLVRAMMSGDKGAGVQLGMKILLFGFTYSMMMRIWAGDDEETDEQHWDRLSDWSKKHNLNLFLQNGGDGQHISIPLPYGWNILYGAGSKLADIVAHKSGNTDREYGIMSGAGDVLTSVVDTFHPMSGGHGLHRFVPHLVRPISEITYNENFLGNPIMPEDNPWGPGKPDSYKYWRSVNPISKKHLLKRLIH